MLSSGPNPALEAFMKKKYETTQPPKYVRAKKKSEEESAIHYPKSVTDMVIL